MKKWRASWLLTLAGIVFVLIGILCLINPLIAYVYLVKFSGLALLLNGFVLQVASSSAHLSFTGEKKSMRIESIVDFIFGLLLLFNPFMTFILYPLLIGYWILSVGFIKIIVALWTRKKNRGWLFVLVLGILSAVFAFGIFYAPSTRAKDVTLIIGAFFIILGSVLLYDSTKLKRLHEMIDLLF
jgi:membrane protein HdeD